MTTFAHQINRPAVPDQLVTSTDDWNRDHVSLFTDRLDQVAQPDTLLRIFAATGSVDVILQTDALPQIAAAIMAHVNYIAQADGQAEPTFSEPTA